MTRQPRITALASFSSILTTTENKNEREQKSALDEIHAPYFAWEGRSILGHGCNHLMSYSCEIFNNTKFKPHFHI